MTRPVWNTSVDWQDQALCLGANPDLFFSPHYLEKKEERASREAQAKAVCARCPVRQHCLDFALSVREPHGIWGGLNEIERRHLAAKRAG
jgi:WhiB family redox-sensing transcriptional regulator